MKVLYLSVAIEEVAEGALWFNDKREGLGGEFWQLVDSVLARIEENPAGFAKSEFATAERDIRFAIIRRFNYVIHFQVEPEEIQILSVAHVSRKPGYWLRRTKE